MNEQPKFHIGQTVYYPALILGHDGAVSRCEVIKMGIDALGAFKGSIFIGLKSGTFFPTRAEAVAKLRAKLETRISHLTVALEAIK